MLTQIILSSYEVLIEITLWVFLLICLVAGWYIWEGVLGAIYGLIVGFVFAVMFFGAFLVLHDIRKSVRALEAKHNS